MKDRPILFSAQMVRAILDGRKTQTRRVVKVQPLISCDGEMVNLGDDKWAVSDGCLAGLWKCPYGQIGDRLWVRETWQSLGIHEHLRPLQIPVGSEIQYPASYDGWVSKRRPSIHMPRWASRIMLEITNVRVERLQDITEADAQAEGAEMQKKCNINSAFDNGLNFSKYGFKSLWESINGPASWDANPWVWVIEFKRV